MRNNIDKDIVVAQMLIEFPAKLQRNKTQDTLKLDTFGLGIKACRYAFPVLHVVLVS